MEPSISVESRVKRAVLRTGSGAQYPGRRRSAAAILDAERFVIAASCHQRPSDPRHSVGEGNSDENRRLTSDHS